MAYIHNSDLTKELIDGGKLQINQGGIPNQLADKVVPVMETNPKLLRVCDVVRSGASTAGNLTLYTTPTDKDFYLVAASLSMSKAVGDSNANCSIRVQTKNSVNMDVLHLSGITLTASDKIETISFPTPLLLNRGSTVIINKDAANSNTSGSIIGFFVENIRA